jgi:hypothetical protein
MKPIGSFRSLIHVEAVMTTTATTTVKSTREGLRIRVTNVSRQTREYARLGLRVLGESSERAVLILPCGLLLTLVGPAARAALDA